MILKKFFQQLNKEVAWSFLHVPSLLLLFLLLHIQNLSGPGMAKS